MKNVVGYIRVSTDNQAGDDKYGIDVQQQEIIKYCEKNDLNLSEEWYIDDGQSGIKENRPRLDDILYGEVANPPVEAVVVFKNDRIARDINLYFYYKHLLCKKNIDLISVNEDFGMMGAFRDVLDAFVVFAASQERENINKRTSLGRGVKAQRGGYSGGRVPFGYRVNNGKFEIETDEAEIVKEIFSLRDEGHAMRGIRDILNTRGYVGRNGRPFTHSTIQSILNNENTYRGMYKYGDMDWVQGQHEPILAD